MSSSWGRNLKISIFGESHGEGIGVVIDGLPSGISIDLDSLNAFMKRRAPGQARYSTPRKERDSVSIQSGFYQGRTTGTPLCGVIKNTNTRSQDYKELPPRPSHADYTGSVRYQSANDPRGGGHFSGRLTAPLVFAGGIAKQILSSLSIYIGAHIASVGTIEDEIYSEKTLNQSSFIAVAEKEFHVLNHALGEQMIDLIEAARLEQDSVGGIVSCAVIGLPPGIGSPMFEGLENKIASIIFGVPAVRGIEFGTGFAASTLRGSVHNDPYVIKNGIITTETNHHGGIIGGISSGMPIQFRTSFKPTPSISRVQQTIDLNSGKPTVVTVGGRHDPCIVPRAVPVVEACAALAILDSILEGGNSIANELIGRLSSADR